MKKVLLFHLYANDIISDNKNYSIHKECLKYFENRGKFYNALFNEHSQI